MSNSYRLPRTEGVPCEFDVHLANAFLGTVFSSVPEDHWISVLALDHRTNFRAVCWGRAGQIAALAWIHRLGTCSSA